MNETTYFFLDTTVLLGFEERTTYVSEDRL